MRLIKESKHQEYLFHYFAIYPRIYKRLFAIANGGSRHKLEALNLKLQGVKPGVPDICLAIATQNYHGLYIELKRDIKPAAVTSDQKDWISSLNEEGYLAIVSYGWVSAANSIFQYLGMDQRVRP